MNTTSQLNQASREVERARMQAAVDAKAAQLAHELVRSAKINLKHARKLAKLARKSARKAEARAGESSMMLESVQAKLEKLREQIRRDQRKHNPAPKSKPAKPTRDTTPRVSSIQSQQLPKTVSRKAGGTRRPARKTVNGKHAKAAPAVAPEPAKPVPASRQELGNVNPLAVPEVAATSISNQEPTND
jgi:hypothetical protein